MHLGIVFFLSALLLLAVTHILALQFFLYWHYFWFDIVMHILGGVCVSLGIGSLSFFRVTLPQRFETLLWYGGAALLVGVLWEIFEIAIGIPVDREGFVLDTTFDLFMDVLGAVIGYGIVKSIQKL